MAHFARNDLEADTAIIVQDATSDYSMGLSEVFAESFEKEGGHVLKRIAYKTPLESYENLIDQIVAIHADVLFLPGYDESGTIIKRCREKGMKAIPLGGDGWIFQEFYKRIGKMGTGSYFCAHYVKHSGALEAMRFENNCPDLISEEASLSDIALGYDTVRLLADAIRRAGNLDHKAIRDALAATKGFQGATGEITYPEDSRDPQKAVAIMKIQGDHAVLVKWYRP
jgi:branched-chain amino acid transport system substrate-binding protein